MPLVKDAIRRNDSRQPFAAFGLVCWNICYPEASTVSCPTLRPLFDCRWPPRRRLELRPKPDLVRALIAPRRKSQSGTLPAMHRNARFSAACKLCPLTHRRPCPSPVNWKRVRPDTPSCKLHEIATDASTRTIIGARTPRLERRVCTKTRRLRAAPVRSPRPAIGDTNQGTVLDMIDLLDEERRRDEYQAFSSRDAFRKRNLEVAAHRCAATLSIICGAGWRWTQATCSARRTSAK